MRTQAQLCHIDANRCVVLVTAYGETDVMGSALGEGSTAEQAEDRALQRLNDRFSNVPTHQSTSPRQNQSNDCRRTLRIATD